MQDPHNDYQRLASSDHGNESSLPHLHEGKLAEAFESVSDPFYAVDRQWRFIYVNRRAQELWGRSQEELLGKNIWEEFPQAVGSESYQKINQAMEEGVTTEFETVSPVLGTWIAGRVYPSPDGLSVYFQDVTERKRTEEALNESNRRTENILESITDEFFALDREWRFTYINERALRRIQGDRGEGLTREDLLGKNIWEVYPELVGSVFYHKYHDAVREQKTSQFEGRSSLSEGWYEVHAYPSAEGLSVYYRDITERKRAEETLRESEERYRKLFESIDEGFAIIEMLYDGQDRAVDYRILETNPAFGRMTGFADAAGKTSLELNPDAEPYWFETLGRVVETGEDVRFENYAEALDRWFDVYASRVGGEDSRRLAIVFADTTERKRAEEELRKSQEALRKSEKFHRLAVEAGRIGTWDLDLQTEECLISPKMAELMDFSPEQTTVPGGQWRKSIVPEDRTLMSSALAPSIASDAPFDVEFRIALKDGRQRWLYSRGAVSRDASGKALRMYGASIDVTERKQAEEKLRESEERLRRAIEIETVGVIFFKTDGSITNANDAFLRMSGYSREDLAEGLVRWDEMTPPEWMPHSLKAIEEFESTGRTIPYEKEFVRKDGSRWWALFAATRLDEEEGVEFIIDITQSKRAEEELRKSGERITNILESITDAFVAVDRQWRFTYINERALTTLQRTREELLGKNMWEEFPEAVGLPAYREYHRAMTSGTPVHFEEFNPWLDIWVEINAYPSEGGLAIYFRDITERKRAEEERDRLRAREIEARTQKEERRRIARDLHDVVLQDLGGVLQSLRLTYLQNKGSGLELDLKEELDALRRATLGLRNAVHDLRGEKERPLVKSVESLVELNRRLAPDRNIDLVIEEGFPYGLPEEVGGELLRVIREALTNARHHSGAKRVEVTLKVEGSDLIAEISDDGQGFALEGTPGVGLSSMQERAAIVDGRLEIESEEGQGTSVRLQVPVPQTE